MARARVLLLTANGSAGSLKEITRAIVPEKGDRTDAIVAVLSQHPRRDRFQTALLARSNALSPHPRAFPIDLLRPRSHSESIADWALGSMFPLLPGRS